jgi:hypothetical protein
MREHERKQDPHWSDDLLVGELPLPTGPALVRLRLHQSEKTYHERHSARLLPVRHPAGTRTYIQARPYLLEPAITLTVGLFPTPETTGAIGEVVDSAWDGMHHVEIGQAQAWPYPGDRLLVLWECSLFNRWRQDDQDDPVQDPALAVLW